MIANWKTSLAGILSGTVFASLNVHDWRHVAIALLISLTGVLAKDHDK